MGLGSTATRGYKAWWSDGVAVLGPCGCIVAKVACQASNFKFLQRACLSQPSFVDCVQVQSCDHIDLFCISASSYSIQCVQLLLIQAQHLMISIMNHLLSLRPDPTTLVILYSSKNLPGTCPCSTWTLHRCVALPQYTCLTWTLWGHDKTPYRWNRDTSNLATLHGHWAAWSALGYSKGKHQLIDWNWW